MRAQLFRLRKIGADFSVGPPEVQSARSVGSGSTLTRKELPNEPSGPPSTVSIGAATFNNRGTSKPALAGNCEREERTVESEVAELLIL